MTSPDPYDVPVVRREQPEAEQDPRRNWAEPFPEDAARRKAEFAEGTPAPVALPDSGRERQRGETMAEKWAMRSAGVENGDICVLDPRGAHLRLARHCPHISPDADYNEVHEPGNNAVHVNGE
jgi:hypothetical protein